MAVAASEQTFLTETFLGENPRNLSRDGFGILVELGIDYRYQKEVTTSILSQIEEFVREKLATHLFGADLRDVIIDFNEAAASSLSVAVIGVFNGSGAKIYFPIKRLLNRISVDACNHFDWIIPFNQLSVHMETPVELSSGAKLISN